jgi:hypothetical protein
MVYAFTHIVILLIEALGVEVQKHLASTNWSCVTGVKADHNSAYALSMV